MKQISSMSFRALPKASLWETLNPAKNFGNGFRFFASLDRNDKQNLFYIIMVNDNGFLNYNKNNSSQIKRITKWANWQ